MTTGTKLAILETGLRLWRVDPAYVTARRIARELDLTHGAVLYHCRMSERSLRDMVAYHAVEQGEARVIAQLITMQHKAVAHMTDAQRLEHLRAAAVR
ncbi:hypothetical protein [Rhizobium phage RHph_X2_24]|nr:hypothetical protein [Rhizobium phage RHph_X2_24]